MASSSSSPGSIWSRAETVKLISLWGQEEIQLKLHECKNKSIYEEVAKDMKDSGYDRNFQQCRDKVKKLKVEYKKVKDKKKKTGTGKPTWEFFDDMDNILGDRPSTVPPVVLDSLDIDETEHQDLEESSQNPDTEVDKDLTEPKESDGETEEPADKGETSSNTSMTSSKTPIFNKKRKRSRQESAATELLEKVLAIQSKSDERMIDLEEKRMKMEERLMEKEAQQRREEREFQMQMMIMMMMVQIHSLFLLTMPIITLLLTNLIWTNHHPPPHMHWIVTCHTSHLTLTKNNDICYSVTHC